MATINMPPSKLVLLLKRGIGVAELVNSVNEDFLASRYGPDRDSAMTAHLRGKLRGASHVLRIVRVAAVEDEISFDTMCERLNGVAQNMAGICETLDQQLPRLARNGTLLYDMDAIALYVHTPAFALDFMRGRIEGFEAALLLLDIPTLQWKR